MSGQRVRQRVVCPDCGHTHRVTQHHRQHAGGYGPGELLQEKYNHWKEDQTRKFWESIFEGIGCLLKAALVLAMTIGIMAAAYMFTM